MGRVPRSLTKKYAELARERQHLKARLGEVESELSAVVYALKLVSPGWTAPKVLPRPQKRVTALPRGGVATACLEALRRQHEMTTPELVRVLVARHRLTFLDKAAGEDFASSVAMALRRYERKGLLDVADQAEGSGALRWRLRTGPDGRLSILPKAA